MPSVHRFPLPWSVDETNGACFIVRDATGQALGYFCYDGRAAPLLCGHLQARLRAPLRAAPEIGSTFVFPSRSLAPCRSAGFAAI